ncbi:hypothetical protein NHX12_004546 [Muraenolepis orangiensis]|uniref:IRG-type G domain-containing protein n=1 Tax=Muraenolepis orangiensis TaxID=630683 RepID=A0A9Q0ICA6_9TELE|nr:hypothetical protein NHX12_004546 [Muraenolepis orangiensis]
MFLESKAIEDIQTALENNDTQAAASISRAYLRDLGSIPLNIAVTGESGSGKSSFVNAFRGIDHKDDRAAPTGPVETTMEPEAYPHPTYSNVTVWDLPGIGTTKFPADKYLEHVGFEKFDFFIIVSSDRFKENDVKLAQEIKKMGKNFYFVRAKIDSNLHSEKNSQKEYDEKKTLQKIKENCIQGLKELGVKAPQVFLVSNFICHLHLYDFPTLQKIMERDLPSHKRDVLILALPNICSSNIEKKKEVLRSQIKFHALASATVAALPIPGLSIAADLGLLVVVITQYLFHFGLDKKSLEKLSSDTRESGSGKSTFVNAFRGIDNRDDRAAPTDVVESTMVLKAYPHPKNPNVTVWDLPGIGTTKFPADQYLKHIGFEKFDFFIIVSSDRFRENDAMLAQEIKKMDKTFYFVRAKIDSNLLSAEKSQKKYNEEKTLQKIKDNCIQGLEEQGVMAPHVFLVSNFDLQLYDFPTLQETMERDLPSHKRDTLILALPNICSSNIKKKKEVLRSRIKMSLESKALAEIVTALKNNDTQKAASITKKYLRDLESIPLNIAVTGESGSGKSTFINAFRGIGDEDEGAAPTGVVETTMKPEAYRHLKYPNVTLWDLPGIGTPKFSADKYLKHVGFEKFDFFIIVSSDRFRENDVKLANEIKKMDKTFYFVRAKIDQNLSSEKRKTKYDEEKTLQEVKENCIQGESGSGKSTFVNAFRGIDHEDERAAPTDVVETTMVPEAYPHPTNPNVTVWDLPGIGTTKFPADEYLKFVEFDKFDFFILVSNDRFRENDAKLAQEIKKMGKTFYFVRAKIDSNLT